MDRKSAHASPAATIKVLEQKAQRYDALLDHLAEGVAVIDLQGHITYANKAFLHISGYSAADLLAKDTSFLFDEENLRIRDSRIESRKQGSTEPYHITITRKD
jgi:PAS domain S-box-containing protein